MIKTELTHFSPECIKLIQDEIALAEGNEVFFVAKRNAEQQIESAFPLARGNENAVPVVFEEAFKGDFVIHNHPSGNLKPSDNDLAIASYLGNQGIGFIIVNNSVNKIYVVVEAIDYEERINLDENKLSAFIDDNGKCAQYFDRFEKRDSQIKMLKKVCQAFNEDNIALIEAGTGIGKSMAYLIPSMHWAIYNKEKVIISTNTINLQEQLIKKDIPFIKKALKLDVKAVLIKGRGNYICLRKLYSSKNDSENELFEIGEQSWIQSVIKAVPTLKEGSRDELSTIVPLEGWGKIASETDTCIKAKCKYFTSCFFFKARKEVHQAQILVVNHHLLCSDIAIKAEIGDDSSAYGVLPPYEKLVIDEAHNLEGVAVQYLGHSVSQFSFKQALSRLYNYKGQMEKGILAYLKRELAKKKEEGDFDAVNTAYDTLTDIILPKFLAINPVIDDFFQYVFDFALDNIPRNSQENKLRIIEGNLSKPLKEQLNKLSNDLITEIADIYESIAHLNDQLIEIPYQIREELFGLINDLKAYHKRLLSAQMNLETFVRFKKTDAVYWLELNKKGNFPWVKLNVSPLNISEYLQDFLFNSKETIIMCSATLSIDNHFRFIKSEIGLMDFPKDRLIEEILPSPFNYKEQMSICVPMDLPLPQQKDFADHVNELLIEVLTKTQGQTFILFTSYGMLNQSYNYLKEHFNSELNIMKQGSLDRHTLLSRFKNGNQSILLGTDSFWEGVDVPGEALKCVVIVKLPFKVPTEPITQGKVEKLEREGKNPFFEYSVPLSVIKFKQGFGRLIRTTEDEGVVICLDKRIITMSYGKIFLKSLPPCNQVIGDSYDTIKELSKYF